MDGRPFLILGWNDVYVVGVWATSASPAKGEISKGLHARINVSIANQFSVNERLPQTGRDQQRLRCVRLERRRQEVSSRGWPEKQAYHIPLQVS